MNAFEIVKNIIPDGIAQSKESISERLQIPDFNEPEPQDIITSFSTPEDWLDLEMLNLAFSNPVYEGEYYLSRPLMSIIEYDKSILPHKSRANRLFKTYNSYYKFWNSINWQIKYREECKKITTQLIDGKLLNRLDFEEMISEIYSLFLFRVYDVQKKLFGSYNDKYEAYRSMWEQTRDYDSREKFLIALEEELYNFIYDHKNRYGTWRDVFEYQKKVYLIEGNYKEQFNDLKTNFSKKIFKWEKRKSDHFEMQKSRIEEILKIEDGYHKKNSEFINRLFHEILSSSKYNFEFSKYIDVDFNSGNKLLMVEYTLPSIENIPTIKEKKYLSSKGEYRNVLISQSDLLKLFDESVYNICLRSIYEIFSNDPLEVIDAVNFNGWIKSINKATGKEENTCIISIQVQRKEFTNIDLERVDPKICFKHFKGIGSSKLYGITAIQPILQIQKNDKRFVDSHTVEFDDSTNLAAMAWEDFEHLIRELFEKEFSSNGGEVKVTQASRDGGVDAIAFDPDPIRGGKIVIQAKRYTNTVGVSAVRDLFGTVMNEGANKGILVTTSDYGSDSYEFAKGKPITLLNGANLLYLLEKHGTRAKIDIKEARRLMNDYR